MIQTVGTVRTKRSALGFEQYTRDPKAAQLYAGISGPLRIPEITNATLTVAKTVAMAGDLAKNHILTADLWFARRHASTERPRFHHHPTLNAISVQRVYKVWPIAFWEFVGGVKMSDAATTPVVKRAAQSTDCVVHDVGYKIREGSSRSSRKSAF